ncbi:class I SAM-dependent methyltransferase [Kribbella sp. CA-294648]|uniref:class I SAM-dependent methyltransferase n=1 Tax=Kribbella sp. CA-294648 TaxID=3239948 RepID=UPI003D8AC768
MLAIYDPLVLGLANRFVWRCPTRVIRDHYAQHLGRVHVEIGPGTGYFLDHVPFPAPDPQITLIDANPGPLAVAGRRLRRYRPSTIRADVLRPLPLPPGSADSVALGFVLHCLPGGVRGKEQALMHAARVVGDTGVVFGATVLDAGVRHSPHSRLHQGLLNAAGVFNNRGDSLEDLAAVLHEGFREVEVSTHGAVALFAARGRRASHSDSASVVA